MTNPFDQLNLRPQERRVVVIVGLLIFVVLNFLLVTPLFGQLGQSENQLKSSETKLAKYETEIAKAPGYEKIEQRLKDEGGDVLSEELQLQRIVQNQANAASVQVSRYNPAARTQTGRTNQFFEDQGLTIDFTSGGKELVDFLVGMASANSMVHVQDMSLRPVQNGTRLGGNIVFIASYQKKTPTARGVDSGSQPRPATKTNAPAAAAPKTNAPTIVKPPVTTPPRTVTNAAKVTNATRTISTKPPKK
jgi:Tfp pilus assembly protein PilO